MTKEIKDYIHYYLGQPCLIGDSKGVDYIRMVNETGLSVCTGTNKNGIPVWYKSNTCKPLLRPLSDMTEEECQECGNLVYDFSDDKSGMNLNDHKPEDFGLLLCSEQFHWLIKQGFWLFGDDWFDEGLIIDKTTQP